MPWVRNDSTTRCGAPVAPTPGSVSTRTLRGPIEEMSNPISSTAPRPNFSCGAPYVKTVSGPGVTAGS